jgi:hypothetical protein
MMVGVLCWGGSVMVGSKKGRRVLGQVRTRVMVACQEGKSNHECQDVLSLWFVLLLPILVGLEDQYGLTKLQCIFCADQAELLFHHQSVGGH